MSNGRTRQGDVAEEILATLGQDPMDLAAIGTRVRSSPAHFPLGGVSRRIIAESDRPWPLVSA